MEYRVIGRFLLHELFVAHTEVKNARKNVVGNEHSVGGEAIVLAVALDKTVFYVLVEQDAVLFFEGNAEALVKGADVDALVKAHTEHDIFVHALAGAYLVAACDDVDVGADYLDAVDVIAHDARCGEALAPEI